MQIQQLNRDNAERVQLIVKNVDGGGSITTGLGVCLVETGASIDGISAARSTAAAWKGFVGIADADIPINGFGTVTSWGYANSIQFSQVGTSLTITRGDVLIPGAVAGTFFSGVTSQALSTMLYRFSFAATTGTISAAGQISGFVRAL